MNFRLIRRILGMTLLVISVTIWLWGIWPTQKEYRHVSLVIYSPVNRSLSEVRMLSLILPKRLRIGDSGAISLVMEAENTAPIAETTPVSSKVNDLGSGSNLYKQDFANILVLSRLEMSGMLAIPQGDLYEGLHRDKPVVFHWSISPQYSGLLKGALWVNVLAVLPDGEIGQGQPEKMRMLLTNQQIEIQAVDFMGLRGPVARLIGGIGIILGAIMGLDGVFHTMIKRFSKEAKRADA